MKAYVALVMLVNHWTPPRPRPFTRVMEGV